MDKIINECYELEKMKKIKHRVRNKDILSHKNVLDSSERKLGDISEHN